MRILADRYYPPRNAVHRAVSEILEPRVLMAFGLTTTASSYTVNTGADLVFSINRIAGSNVSVGDLTSMQYGGTELEAPFSSTNRYSHYESGLSSNTVITTTVDPSDNWIEIACNDTGTGGVGIIQYYIAYKGLDNIYMATYAPGPSAPSPGEMRFITYLNHTALPNAPAASNLIGNTGAIESTDVYGFANGQTASKYYGEYEAIDDPYHGLTGSGFGVLMNMGSRENSSGGPFFKDIDYQTTSSKNTDSTGWTELYNYMYSGHSQTENFRPGLQGPYALEFTNGGQPASVDYSFIDALNLTGQIHASARGTLTGNAGGVPSGHEVTVGIASSTAQYWATPDPTTGNYTITGIEAGTYTETLYQDELAVGTQTVTISAQTTTTCNITDTYYLPSAVFRIGTWDGTPVGFLNANLIQNMHPSDSRMSPWVNTTYTVGTTPDSSWPMAQWKDPALDNINTINFNLTAAQTITAMTLRIGITRADSNSASGRPIISVNGGSYSSAPTPSTQPSTRGVTVGNWRGNNYVFTYNISTSAVHTGSNTIAIEVTSGSSSTDPYLEPYVIYDAIDLVATSSLTNAPHVASIAVAPSSPALATNEKQVFGATAHDQFGNVIATNFTWSATHGVIDGAGDYTAPSTPGTDMVTATSGSISGSANITVATPTTSSITVSPPSPSLSDGQTVQLAATAFDQFGNAMSPQPSFTWSVDSGGAGSINATGLYTAPASGPGSDAVRATSGSISGTAAVTVILSDIAGTSGADSIRLVRSGTALQVYFGTTLGYSVAFASLGAVTVSGGNGNDIITIDFSGGASPIPSAGLTVDGGSGNDVVAITGTSSSDSLSVSTSSLIVDGATILLLNDESIAVNPVGNQAILLGSLSIAAGALLQTDPGNSAVMTLSSNPTIAGTLDLGNSQLTVQNGGASALSNLTMLLKAGFNAAAGYWNGTGIISSVAASDPTHLTTLGVILNSSSNVVVQPAYYGDADLNGALNGADYQQIDSGFGLHLAGWVNGDFNYDGLVDGSDYSLIDNAFNQVLAGNALPLARVQTTPPAVAAKTAQAAAPRAAVAPPIFADSNVNLWDLYIESRESGS